MTCSSSIRLSVIESVNPHQQQDGEWHILIPVWCSVITDVDLMIVQVCVNTGICLFCICLLKVMSVAGGGLA